MRKWLFIVAAALMALSCSREREQDWEEVPEGKVKISFSVTGDQLATKALGEAPQLETMHVAVFGGSGYLKEYLEADLESEGTYVYHYEDDEGNPVSKEVPAFTYSVQLTLSNSSRRIHFLGNAPGSIPFGRDYEVLPALLGEKETGFWQMITLSHITARKDEDEDYLTPDGQGGYRKRQDGEPYVPSEELQDAFKNVPLIRNWAKIELKAAPAEQSNFTPISFAVVNVPKKGALVPYGGVKGFVTNYKDLSFEDLRGAEYNYGGNLPSSVEFDSTIPTDEDFRNFSGGVKRYTAEAFVDKEDYTAYLYERPVPDANIPPTYLIVYGKYYNPEDTFTDEEIAAGGAYCYYKVDLMTGSEYYPVLRNFKYMVRIDKISARGQTTPEEAAAAAGSADVSADINASALPDISDGTRRMAIQPWMSKTYIEEKTGEQLFVTFYNDINGANPAPDLTAVSERHFSYKLSPESAGIVKNVVIGEAEADPSKSNYGWRPITFDIASPEEAAGRTQTLRIMCKVDPDDEDESPLYRDVVISLLPTQTMRVKCGSPRVLLVSGEKQRIDVDIPDGLVESMFPLKFIIEAKNLTLTPDTSVEGNDLPVISETSIIGDYPSFHYQRVVEWSEYKSLTATLDYEDDSRWRTFSSYFKTNCEQSASAVYVANEFFYTANTSFSNFASFRDPKFTTPILRKDASEVNVSASLMIDQASYEPVYLTLEGLEPASSDISWDDEMGMYKYTPTSAYMTFPLRTTVSTGEVSVTLQSADASYEPVVLTPWHFKEAQVLDIATPNGTTHTGNDFAQVVHGHVNSLGQKQVLVGYFTDEQAPGPQTTVRELNGLYTSHTTWSDTGPVSSTARTLYRETWLGTEEGTGPVSLILSAVGYVEELVSAPRFKGNIYTLDMKGATEWNTLVSDSRFQKNVTVEQEKATFTVEITGDKELQKHGDSTTDGIILPAGGHYEIEVNIGSDHGDIFLFYGQLFYYEDNGTVLKPRAAEPYPDGSIYYGYQGNNKEYIWNLPQKETGGKLVLDAPSGSDIVLSRLLVRGFHGMLNSSGNAGGGDVGLGDDLEEGGKL